MLNLHYSAFLFIRICLLDVIEIIKLFKLVFLEPVLGFGNILLNFLVFFKVEILLLFLWLFARF